MKVFEVFIWICSIISMTAASTSLDNRLCMTNQVGNDFIYSIVNKMFQQYFVRWDDFQHAENSKPQDYAYYYNTYLSEIYNMRFVPKDTQVRMEYTKNETLKFTFDFYGESIQNIEAGTNKGKKVFSFDDTLILEMGVKDRIYLTLNHDV